jgi:hypothetical protein
MNMKIKTWHIVLTGAIVGPLIGLPMLLMFHIGTENPLVLPVTYTIRFLGRVLSDTDRFAGIAYAAPVTILYFSTIGVLVALAARYLLRRLSHHAA